MSNNFNNNNNEENNIPVESDDKNEQNLESVNDKNVVDTADENTDNKETVDADISEEVHENTEKEISTENDENTDNKADDEVKVIYKKERNPIIKFFIGFIVFIVVAYVSLFAIGFTMGLMKIQPPNLDSNVLTNKWEELTGDGTETEPPSELEPAKNSTKTNSTTDGDTSVSNEPTDTNTTDSGTSSTNVDESVSTSSSGNVETAETSSNVSTYDPTQRNRGIAEQGEIK